MKGGDSMKAALRNLPFKFRIFFGCLLVALIPTFFSGIFMVRIFNASLLHQSEKEIEIQLDDLQQRLSQLLLSCETVYDRFAGNQNAYWVMIDNSTTGAQQELYLYLYQTVQESYSYARYSFYDAGGMLKFSTGSGNSTGYLPVRWGLLRKASQHGGLVYYRTDPYLNADPDILFQAAFPLENPTGVRSGYLVIDFTWDSFNYLFGSYYTGQDVIMLLDQSGAVIYCSRPEFNRKDTFSLQEQLHNLSQADSHLIRTIENPDYGYTLLLQKRAPISSPAMDTMNTLSITIALLVLWLCLIISLVLSRGISQPVRQLDQAMQKVREGDLSIRINTNRKDELGRLSESFNRMTRELSEYLETVIKKQKDLNDTSLKLYQTQLNPHFLYNTLDTIKWGAKINNDPEIPILAENLAEILRYSISSEPFTTLNQELLIIECYIQIQKIRFAGRFLYETEIPWQLENCLIPKMILQPLVENAILHGLEGCTHGYICIYARSEDSGRNEETTRLNISVTDNGSGMSEEMLAWINSPNPPKRDGHFGLYNIIQILKLYYGPEYGLSAWLNPEGGTTVTISLPLERR